MQFQKFSGTCLPFWKRENKVHIPKEGVQDVDAVPALCTVPAHCTWTEQNSRVGPPRKNLMCKEGS